MKQIVFLLAVGSVILLSSCETTKEITLQPDGTGTYVNTMDMSGMIGMAKMAGQSKEMDKMKEEKPVDTTIELKLIAENTDELSSEERDLVKNGTLGINMDMKNDKLVIRLNYPVSSLEQIAQLDKASQKVIEKFLKSYMEQGKGDMPQGMDEGIPQLSVDQYYSLTSSIGVVERKFVKEKFDNMEDKEKEALKQLSQTGLGNTTLILNLPSPVKKTEGKNITVSDDKKKVTITSDAGDFFDSPKDMEFRIEY